MYSRLPFEEFFHLRIVCKDWYDFACRRLALKEPIHKPFFTLFTKGIHGRLDGILIYEAYTQSWDWRTSWTLDHSCQCVASEGVVYSPGDWYLGVGSNPAGAFHWQSKMYQTLHPPPTPPNSDDKTILGMGITEKGDHFSEFRVVRGSQGFDTQVYESGVWQTKPCRVPKPETGGDLQASTGCVDCNGRVYITTEHVREIFIYDFEKASWSSLLGPCNGVSKQPQHYCPDTLGAWNGRIFDVTDHFRTGNRKRTYFLCVWELVDETLQMWEVYDRMPKDLCSWLRSKQGFRPLNTKVEDISIQASFCGDYMLVYSWDFTNGSAGRFCLFNMAAKNWQKLKIPSGTVVIDEESSDDSDSEDTDDSYDLDAFANDSSLDDFMMEDYDSDSDWGF